MRYHIFTTLALSGILTLEAQYSHPRVPASFQQTIEGNTRSTSSNYSPAVITLDAAPNQSLRSEVTRFSELRPFTFAIDRSLPTISATDGEWIKNGKDGYTWRLSIVSPSAKRISLRLDNYRMPEGASLYVYGTDRRIKGAFTHENNAPDGILQLAPTLGDTITIEYEPPLGYRSTSELPFRIANIQHAYIDPLKATTAQEEAQRISYGWVNGEPYFNHRGSSLSSLDCASNVLLYPESSPSSRSVVLMVTEGNTLSSGALINNTRSDGTAYILTAAHCVNRLYGTDDLDEIKAIVRTAVFFFDFESPRPDGNIRASEEKTLSGAELVAYNEEADMALLRITGLPTTGVNQGRIPASYRPFFAGWNLSISPEAPYYNIHHPYGTTKRYNQANDHKLNLVNYRVTLQDGDKEWTNRHWYITQWGIGTTQSGSSGSPLFDAQGYIIGALTGGRSSCRNPQSDYFYAIRQTWSNQSNPIANLSDYLDPDQTGREQCSAYDPDQSNSVRRASYIYAQKGLNLESQVQSGTTGVGQRFTLPQTGRITPLGAYFVFASHAELQTKFPRLILELSPISNGKVEQAIWTHPITELEFNRYEGASAQFSTAARTLQADTIEVFVPIAESLQHQVLGAGDYLLSLRSESSAPFTLPLVYHPQRSTTETVAQVWQRDSDGTWGVVNNDGTQTPRVAYWLDLVYQGSTDVSLIGNDLGQRDISLYHHGGYINVYYPYNDHDATLHVYSMAGETLIKHQLTMEENRIALHNLLSNGVYVAYIRSPHSNRSIKFVHKAQ